ncbi:MAG: archaetidylserine decarboxylase [Verrucomicrobiota bacterium]|nr:archaetidylserine decarboxylase [Verrucomicrobiota bacterium]MEC8790970.1 archaetidylserine decarboxylase [Verrucomicrobiota bacterium]
MIQFFNRSKGTVETERVYGENWLKLIYDNPFGKLLLWAAVKKSWFSRWYGWRMSQPASKARIRPFIRKYKLDEEEFDSDPEGFRSFNEFFSRKLKPDARPIEQENAVAVFPADGRHLGVQDLSANLGFYVKGQKFDLPKLFQSDELAGRFRKGSLIISRLCPVDYHRFHAPVSGKISEARLINGSLFSVNPIALRKRLSVFWENKRYLCMIDSDYHGKIAQFIVGATCVGSATFTFSQNQRVKKGEELGYFSFGGSSVLTLFEKDRLRISEDVQQHSQANIETYAKMGEEMGRAD